MPLTTGSHYLLLGNAPAAIEGYERGLAIEPRAELYLNLARALALAGRRDEAVARAAQAVALDPGFENDAVKLGLREPRPAEEEERDEARREKRRRRGRRRG